MACRSCYTVVAIGRVLQVIQNRKPNLCNSAKDIRCMKMSHRREKHTWIDEGRVPKHVILWCSL